MRKIIRALSGALKGTAGKTAVSMGITGISKIAGFVKSALFAYLFGASVHTDAFYMATSIYSTLSGMTSSLTQVLIPIRAKALAEAGHREADRVSSMLLSISCVATLLLGIIMLFATDVFVTLFAPSFTGEAREYTMFCLRALSPVMIAACLGNFAVSLLNSHRRFVWASTGAMVINVSSIVLAVFLAGRMGTGTLMFSFVVGTALNLAFVLAGLRGIFRFSFRIDWKDENLRRAFVMWVPIAIGTMAGTVNQAVDKALASAMTQGSVTAINYANQLVYLVIGVISVPIMNALFVSLSDHAQQSDLAPFKALLSRVLTVVMLLIFPITLLCLLFDGEIVSIVYQRGAFDAQASDLTATAFFYYSMILPPYAAGLAFNRCFFALHDTKTPLLVGIFGIAADTALSVALAPSMGVGGLMLGSSISSMLSAVIQLFLLRKKIGALGMLGWMRDGAKACGALAALAAVALPLRAALAAYPPLSFAAATLAGAAAYVASLLLLRQRDTLGAARKLLSLITKNG